MGPAPAAASRRGASVEHRCHVAGDPFAGRESVGQILEGASPGMLRRGRARGRRDRPRCAPRVSGCRRRLAGFDPSTTGRFSSVHRGNSLEYDAPSGRIWHASSSAGVLDVKYGELDEAGNVTNVTDFLGNVTKITDSQLGVETFEPDGLDRLKVANGPWGKLEYAYKPVGNRDSVTLTRAGVSDTTNYSYDAVTNRLSGTSGAQTETFGHDASGRVTSDGRASLYSYTPSGLLETAVMRAGVQQAYGYNADDERVLKIVGGGQSRTYAVNGLSEFSTEGGPITWTVDYLYAGSRLLGVVRPAPGSLYTLGVTNPGDGTGRVSGLPAGLDCGPAWSASAECSARYVSGTTVTLTAAPEPTSYFAGWGGACGGTLLTADVTIEGATDCVATFVSNKLTVTLAGDGTGTVSAAGFECDGTQCSGAYPLQTVVTLDAIPGTGSAFSGWSGDVGCGQSVTMTAALNCTATFSLSTASYTLTVLKTGEGSAGSLVASNPPGISCGAACRRRPPDPRRGGRRIQDRWRRSVRRGPVTPTRRVRIHARSCRNLRPQRRRKSSSTTISICSARCAR